MQCLSGRSVVSGAARSSTQHARQNSACSLTARQLPLVACRAQADPQQPEAPAASAPRASVAATNPNAEVVDLDRDLVASKMMYAAKKMTASKRKVRPLSYLINLNMVC